MKTENKTLLEEVISSRLNVCLKDIDNNQAFDEAMKAIDRSNELTKLEVTKMEKITSNIIRGVEIVAVGIAVPVGLKLIDNKFKLNLANAICLFEKDDTFTTSIGRSLTSFMKK